MLDDCVIVEKRRASNFADCKVTVKRHFEHIDWILKIEFLLDFVDLVNFQVVRILIINPTKNILKHFRSTTYIFLFEFDIWNTSSTLGFLIANLREFRTSKCVSKINEVY